MNNGPRVVRCTIEMDLIEGRDFPASNSDTFLVDVAKIRFFENIYFAYKNADSEIWDYIQTKIVEEPT